MMLRRRLIALCLVVWLCGGKGIDMKITVNVSQRYSDALEFDKYSTTYYTNKLQQCKDRNIEFKLSFVQVKNMLRAKQCQLTGIALTHTNAGKAAQDKCPTQRPTDVTIDRIDNSKGYEKGNVCAVSHVANSVKNGFEMGYGKNAIKAVKMMAKKLGERGF